MVPRKALTAATAAIDPSIYNSTQSVQIGITPRTTHPGVIVMIQLPPLRGLAIQDSSKGLISGRYRVSPLSFENNRKYGEVPERVLGPFTFEHNIILPALAIRRFLLYHCKQKIHIQIYTYMEFCFFRTLLVYIAQIWPRKPPTHWSTLLSKRYMQMPSLR